jgi:hypothetical protein
VYVIHGGFDVLTKFSPDGEWLWSKRYGEIVSRQLADKADIQHRPTHGLSHVWATPDGNVLLTVRRRSRVDDFTKRLIGLVVDPDGHPLQVAPTFELVSYAELIVSPTPAPELRDPTLTIRDSQGAVTQEVQMELDADGGIHFEDGLGPPHPHVLRDTGGNFYTYSYAELRESLRPDSKYYEGPETVINKFNSRGRFLEEWRFVRSVFSAGAEARPDRDGNLYHIRFDDEGVEVVRYRRVPEGSSAPEGTEAMGDNGLHGLVSFRMGDITMASLARLAAKANAPVAWEAEGCVATVTTKAGPLVLDPERNRATLNGDPVEIGGPLLVRRGRLWVPLVEVRRLLGLPIGEVADGGAVAGGAGTGAGGQ